MHLYAELVFLDNFLMDFLLCWLSLRLTKLKIILLNVSIGALFGGIYAALAPAFPLLLHPVFKIAVSFGICFLSSGMYRKASRISLKKYFILVLCLYICSFISGGAMTAIMYALGIPVTEGFIRLPYLRYVLLGAAITVALCEWLLRRRVTLSDVYDIEIRISGSIIFLKGIVDTGNTTKDFGGQGVIFADRKHVLAQLCGKDRSLLQTSDTSVKKRLFALETASGAAVAEAFMPDSIIVRKGTLEYRIICYIGLCDHIHCKNCNALIGADMLVFAEDKSEAADVS